MPWECQIVQPNLQKIASACGKHGIVKKLWRDWFRGVAKSASAAGIVVEKRNVRLAGTLWRRA